MTFFSAREVRDIVVSVAALAVVFSYPEAATNPVFLLVSLLTVGIAFIGHELAHKVVARRKGFWAEYRMWPQGILLALLFALATGGRMVFAAPGAVYFAARFLFQRESRRDVGAIGIAGIVFNLALAGASLGAFLIIPAGIFRFMALANSWLALFNLLPIPPLDGSKVLAWNPVVWGAAIALSAGLVLLAI